MTSNDDHFLKDPDATVDFGIDWSDWLGTDTISTSTWTIQTGSGLTTPANSHTTTVATIWLSGGTIAEGYYRVSCRIVTAGGRTDDRSIFIRVIDR